jgi:flagellar biosynthesis chaperone FliJ
MLSKDQFFNFLKINNNKEFSKEEIINRFAESNNDEQSIDRLLAELEVESTYTKSNLNASCKSGTVYYKWKSS